MIFFRFCVSTNFAGRSRACSADVPRGHFFLFWGGAQSGVPHRARVPQPRGVQSQQLVLLPVRQPELPFCLHANAGVCACFWTRARGIRVLCFGSHCLPGYAGFEGCCDFFFLVLSSGQLAYSASRRIVYVSATYYTVCACSTRSGKIHLLRNKNRCLHILKLEFTNIHTNERIQAKMCPSMLLYRLSASKPSSSRCFNPAEMQKG